MISNPFTPFRHRQAKSSLISWVAFIVPVIAIILGCSTRVEALEFRSVAGPPETGGSILRGGILVIGCTFNYPGDLESSSLYLVDTAGNRTQVSFTSLDSSTSQAFSRVNVPQEVEGGHYFLVAVETNRSVIASSPNFNISSATATNASSISSSSTSDPTSSQVAAGSSESSSPNAGAIAGGVIGGVVGLALTIIVILLFLKRRKAERERSIATPDISEYFTQPTPLVSEGPSTEAKDRYLRMQEQKEQMLGMRERLERRLEDNMAEERMRVMNPDGSAASESDQDTVPELRRQLDIMSQRIQVLEAELAEQAPPDYVSTI
ncbi:hypothetical protein Moror_16368 [Moniliophthora roreri MCA 2997]|uniref:Uncharacterized protein n=1 Tax=Moniliophthora roreri (strain MCA 2997) TaxID=1381753 RepID=V2XEM5_MONRO|nr:hypothetical protein Moror_16368 [Moniliophthora roreri MCA 2997]